MGYEWQGWALDALRGIEPHEVMQVLAAKRRWARPATSEYGLQLVTVWGRTSTGRALIVAVRQVSAWDWQILGARDLRPEELDELEQWEATHD